MNAAAARRRRGRLAARAGRLYQQGRTVTGIASELGISLSYASSLILDPDRSKERARKERYRGTCRGCGERTSSSGGDLCVPCSAAEQTVWDADAITVALRRFAAERGRPPTAADLSPGLARQKAAKYVHPDAKSDALARATFFEEAGWLPSSQTVRARFGTLREALEQAGIEPAPAGCVTPVQRARMAASQRARTRR